MAKKHESETIRQQKIARQEFLELKKMQSGEIETGPKPSEVAIVPKTFSEKIANIWYHFGKIIAVVFILVVAISVMIVQCATRTKYDLKIIYFSCSVLPDTTTGKIANYFEKYCNDVNGDGEVHVSIVDCSYNPNYNNTAKLQKLQTLIVAEPSTVLYITDDESIKYFDNINTDNGSFFTEKSKILSKNFYDYCNSDTINLPSDLTIRMRNIDKSKISKEKEIKESLDASTKLLNSIK